MLSQIGVRMLRHYDKINLLHPAYVDDSTNYRYYKEEQLLVANRIQSLKSMGMSLKEIKYVLDKYEDSEFLEQFLKNELVKRQEEIAILQDRISYLKCAINSLHSDNIKYGCNILLKEIPEHNVISYRRKISSYKDEQDLFQTLYYEAANQNIQLATPLYSTAIYHDDEYKEDNIDVEVQYNVIGKYSGLQSIAYKRMPSMLVVSVAMEGKPDYMPELNIAVAKWIKDNNYIFCGPMYNVYLVPPANDTSSFNWFVEVCFPVKKKNFFIQGPTKN